MKPLAYSTACLALLMSVAGAAAANPDPTGKAELGVDISRAGTTAEEHQKFVQSLSPGDQSNVRKQCSVIVSQPGNHAPPVVAFCNDVNAAPATAAAMSPAGDFSVTIPDDAVLSYNLIGLDVYNKSHEDIGEIKDLVLQGGKLIGYIVSVGGFLGIGEHYVVVAPGAIATSYDQANSKWTALMDIGKDQLKNAPEFKYEGKFEH